MVCSGDYSFSDSFFRNYLVEYCVCSKERCCRLSSTPARTRFLTNWTGLLFLSRMRNSPFSILFWTMMLASPSSIFLMLNCSLVPTCKTQFSRSLCKNGMDSGSITILHKPGLISMAPISMASFICSSCLRFASITANSAILLTATSTACSFKSLSLSPSSLRLFLSASCMS
jgi:hypothetical protein